VDAVAVVLLADDQITDPDRDTVERSAEQIHASGRMATSRSMPSVRSNWRRWVPTRRVGD
jgi:hypothetical protein